MQCQHTNLLPVQFFLFNPLLLQSLSFQLFLLKSELFLLTLQLLTITQFLQQYSMYSNVSDSMSLMNLYSTVNSFSWRSMQLAVCCNLTQCWAQLLNINDHIKCWQFFAANYHPKLHTANRYCYRKLHARCDWTTWVVQTHNTLASQLSLLCSVYNIGVKHLRIILTAHKPADLGTCHFINNHHDKWARIRYTFRVAKNFTGYQTDSEIKKLYLIIYMNGDGNENC